ncbi:hypothetical protein HDU93_004268, partial [Gonapodya sp. JEL0774]
TYGGLDVVRLSQAVVDPAPRVKEDLALPIDMHRIEMAFGSRLDSEVDWALETMTVVSAANDVVIRLPYFASVLVELVKVWDESLSVLDSGRTGSEYKEGSGVSEQSRKRKREVDEEEDPFKSFNVENDPTDDQPSLDLPDAKRALTEKSYARLLEEQYEATVGPPRVKNVEIRPTDRGDPLAHAMARADAAALIVRNLSFASENGALMGRTVGFADVLLRAARLGETPVDSENHPSCRVPASFILESRKNLVVLLSNVTSYLAISDPSAYAEFLLLLASFVDSENPGYTFAALEGLAKLTTLVDNQAALSALADSDVVPAILDVVLESLPEQVNEYTASEDVACAELALMTICNFAVLGDTPQSHLATRPGFIDQLLGMIRFPASTDAALREFHLNTMRSKMTGAPQAPLTPLSSSQLAKLSELIPVHQRSARLVLDMSRSRVARELLREREDFFVGILVEGRGVDPEIARILGEVIAVISRQ